MATSYLKQNGQLGAEPKHSIVLSFSFSGGNSVSRTRACAAVALNSIIDMSGNSGPNSKKKWNSLSYPCKLNGHFYYILIFSRKHNFLLVYSTGLKILEVENISSFESKEIL